MKASAHAFEIIKQFEGLRLKTYLDEKKIYTIGYGHTGPDVKPDGVITEQEALDLLVLDVRDAERDVSAMVRIPLTQNQFDALVSFVFNIGGLRFSGSSVLRLLNACELEKAALSMLEWHHVDKKDNDGLKSRRQLEYDLFMEAT